MKLGAQYMIDVSFPKYKDGTDIDHDALSVIMLRALKGVEEELEKAAGQPMCLVQAVVYETDYPIEDDGSEVA